MRFLKTLVLSAAVVVAAEGEALAAQEPAPRRNPKIENLVGEISADNLKGHVDALSAIHSRHIESEGIRRAQQYIQGEFAKIPGLKVELDEFEQQVRRLQNRTVKLVNVVATLPGTVDPDRYYLVSGHYDSRASRADDSESRAPGAVDDGSGTAAVLELARVLSQKRFEASLVFIAFTAEEVGLLGSTHWAEQAKAKGLDIEAMITNDIVGNSQGGGGQVSDRDLRVFSEGVPEGESEQEARLRRSIGGEVDSSARQLARYVKEIGEIYVPDMRVHLIYRRDRFGRGGDHTPFSRVGYPAVRLTEMYENYYRQHQDLRTEAGIRYGDVPEFYDAQYAARICRVNAAVLASLADAPPAPRNPRIGGGVEYDTFLSWEGVESADIEGYVVLVRDTASATWQRRIPVGNTTEHVLKGAIVDNNFFAVQSVDRDGNLSRPVFPVGMRRR